MTEPITTAWTDIPSPEGHFGGFLALPPAGRGPGLLLLQEIFGVNDHIQAVAKQYALDGFVVLAPDLFWRQQPRVALGYDGADREQAYGLMQTLTAEGAMADLRASVAALRARPELNGQVAALGYCMGGRLAFAAATQPGVDAAVAYYGGGIQNQLDLAPQVQCPVQFHYGERDDHIPLSAVDQVRSAMAGKPHECHVYPGAQHGFNCWARASYDPRSAVLAHARTLAFLAPLF
jgi:carboxymethylenebutenolidase